MAIDRITLKLLKKHIAGARILCLSYPDIVIPTKEVEQYLGVEILLQTDHGKNHKLDFKLPETIATLKAAGAVSVDCIDRVVLRSVERVVDLNCETIWPQEYDLVINPGTLEHCFNIGQAWRNAWSALKVGGVIVHVAPCSMINHGFWNINPTTYYDFAEENGGEVLKTVVAVKDSEVAFEARRRCSVPSNAVIYCKMVKREQKEFVWPTQWRYRGLG